MAGKVYLIGAGPGDAGLLTVKAQKILEKAETVVYDRLVGKEIIDMLPEEAILIDVGKNAGNHPVPQQEISELLAKLAKKGDVVRLKGGDSFVFGRGGEEIETLNRYGIAYEVVPGITSAIAAAAYAGIPVTHRDFCSSLHIITGHKKKNEKLDLDYQSLVGIGGTLVFMMSVSNAGEIMEGLLAAGMEPDMPAAVIENGTKANQRKFIADVGRLGSVIQQNEVVSPAVILVGKVCLLSGQMDWFSKLPLFGRKIVVTRPKDRAGVLYEKLKALGADITSMPAVETVPCDFPMPDLNRYTALIFTSPAGVNAFFCRLLKTGDARMLYGKTIAAIGNATAKEMEKYGIRADFIPTEYSGEILAKELVATRTVTKNDRLILLRARQGSDGLPKILEQNEIPFDETAVYDILYRENALPTAKGYDLVTFTSASCVKSFVRGTTDQDFNGVSALCIGKQTARQAEAFGFDVIVSKQASIDSMIEAALEYFGA